MVLNVIPVSVFSTLRGIKARYAGVVPVSVVQPGAVARILSMPAAHALARLSIKALAQHALAADAASRRARSCVFQRQFLLQYGSHQSVAAPLKRNPLGESQFVLLSRSITAFYGAVTKERHIATKSRIERGMKARCAAWFCVALSQPVWCECPLCCRGSVQRLVHTSVIRMLVMPRGSVQGRLNPAWDEGSLCCVWFLAT